MELVEKEQSAKSRLEKLLDLGNRAMHFAFEWPGKIAQSRRLLVESIQLSQQPQSAESKKQGGFETYELGRDEYLDQLRLR